jgi:hypothetical protein
MNAMLEPKIVVASTTRSRVRVVGSLFKVQFRRAIDLVICQTLVCATGIRACARARFLWRAGRDISPTPLTPTFTSLKCLAGSPSTGFSLRALRSRLATTKKATQRFVTLR